MLRGATIRPVSLAAFALLAAALAASDPLGLFASTIPMAGFLAVHAAFDRGRRRAFVLLFGTIAIATLIGSIAPDIIELAGGFQTTWPVQLGPIPVHSIGDNLIRVGQALARLAGVGPFYHSAPWNFYDVVRAVAAGVIVAGCASTVARFRQSSARVGSLLLVCAVFLLIASAASQQFYVSGPTADRYLAPTYIFAAIAAAIELPRLVGSLSENWRRAALAIGLALGLVQAAITASPDGGKRPRPPVSRRCRIDSW